MNESCPLHGRTPQFKNQVLKFEIRLPDIAHDGHDAGNLSAGADEIYAG
jgi:hypothetical protein